MDKPFFAEARIDEQGRLRIGERYLLAGFIDASPAGESLCVDLPVTEKPGDRDTWLRHPSQRCLASARSRCLNPDAVTDVEQLSHNIDQISLVVNHPEVAAKLDAIDPAIVPAWNKALAAATEALKERLLPIDRLCRRYLGNARPEPAARTPA